MPAAARAPGYVHASAGRLVDGDGHARVFRGVGLGTWLLPEGYMWRFGPSTQSPRQIESAIERVAGADYAATFWPRFRAAFITESDVAHIAAAGFDHVRLPINARVIQDADGGPIEAGYALIDNLIEWCERHGLYVLLDLHGAPGGQTGTNIDDSPGTPDLFLKPGYRELTVQLWRTMARRYRDSTTVMGYDLLNEPLPPQWGHQFDRELVALYRELTAAVRAEDPHHLIMYEGSHWATNWNVFTEVWDPNSALQFHKYWSPPDAASLAPYLGARERLGLPIFMGEGGENSPEWLYTVTRLYETCEIGWNLWTWKKLDGHSSPASIRRPADWDRLVAAMESHDPLPREQAQAILDEYLSACRIENCDWRRDVVAAVLALEPRTLPAWGYGHRGPGESYAASETASGSISGFRTPDAVALRFAVPFAGNPFEHGDGERHAQDGRIVAELAPGQWLEFELEGGADASQWRAEGADGLAVDATVMASPRGVRVQAGHTPVILARLVRTDPAASGPSS